MLDALYMVYINSHDIYFAIPLMSTRSTIQTLPKTFKMGKPSKYKSMKEREKATEYLRKHRPSRTSTTVNAKLPKVMLDEIKIRRQNGKYSTDIENATPLRERKASHGLCSKAVSRHTRIHI